MQVYTVQTTGNGLTHTQHGTPFRPDGSMSNEQSGFSTTRRVWSASLGRLGGAVVRGPQQQQQQQHQPLFHPPGAQKRWFGTSDRAASTRLAQIKAAAVGRTSTTLVDNALSFKGGGGGNDVRQARWRTRNSGGGMQCKGRSSVSSRMFGGGGL